VLRLPHGIDGFGRCAGGCGTKSALDFPHEHVLWEKVMAADASGETLSILVVEDEVAVAELIRTILNQEPGWGATVVHDAAAAREVFRHVRIEVLVVDVGSTPLNRG
jgi:PleD family two-component response regulator